MEIRIIAVGKVREHDLLNRVEHYLARIAHDARIGVVEIRDSDPVTEGRRILEALSKERSAAVVALGEEGRLYSSRDFARFLDSTHRRIVFVIGGPEGLSPEVKQAAGHLLSLSSMTFTHEIARMLLLEQVYRALSIIKNRKYHRD